MVTEGNPIRQFMDSGLDYSKEEFSPEDQAAHLQWYSEHHSIGGVDLAPFARFQMIHDPGGFKNLRRYIFTLDGSANESVLSMGAGLLLFIFSYAALGYGKGTFYETIAFRNIDGRKEEVLEAIRLAAFMGGPIALNPLGELMTDYLIEWPGDQGTGIEWPAGWTANPQILRSGINHLSDDLTDAERLQLFSWYERHYGAVPFHVRLLADSEPQTVKASRIRLEGAYHGVLPPEAVPLLFAHLAAIRRYSDDLKTAAHLARSLGVLRSEFISALRWTAVFGGEFILEYALGACEDILTDWS